MNLREHIATDGLTRSIEGNFGLEVGITYPDGDDQTLKAQVLYDTESLDPENGDLISVENTFVTFVKANLDQEITNGGGKYYFKIPKSPSSSEQIAGMFDGSKSLIDGESVGFVRVPLTDPEQAT